MYVASGLTKRFGGVFALAGVDFEVHAGEVQALLGANGAGKSTLVKILVGSERATTGTLHLKGSPVRFANHRDAFANGIAIVSQELSIFPQLSVVENLFLSRAPARLGVVDRGQMRELAAPVLAAVGLDVPPERKAGDLTLAEQQLVEIARALLSKPTILLLDEPTSALQAAEVRRLLDVVRSLRAAGVAVVYVSHLLDDVFAIADTITVLRSGRVVMARQRRDDTTIDDVVSAMVAAPVAARSERAGPDPAGAPGELRIDALEVAGRVERFDLVARRGEIVGLAGLAGSGAEDVLDVVFGRRPATSGTVTLPNGRRGPTSTTRAVRAGVAYVPPDRKRLGLMPGRSVADNVGTVRGGPLRGYGSIVRARVLAERTRHWSESLGITSSGRSRADALSGGNQQKVLFAKWLEAEPDVVVLNDPTRGVDVAAGRDAPNHRRSRGPRVRRADDVDRPAGAVRTVRPGGRVLPWPCRARVPALRAD